MFNSTLQKINQRESYIDQLSEEQIATIQTKELFFQALEETPYINSFPTQSQYQDQQCFLSPHIDGPATTLLKHILPAPQNSYEQIQQLQARMNLFTSKKLNQVQILKSMFDQEKQRIRASGLKVSDFLDLYESEQMQAQDKDIYDPLIKKITTCFESNTKENSLEELLSLIIEGISIEEQSEKQERSQNRMIRKVRQSVCSLQGFEINIEGNENQFNQETRKQMDKIWSYYHSLLQVFDIQNEQ